MQNTFSGELASSQDDPIRAGRTDLDADGRLDCWRIHAHQGAGVEGYTVSVQPGCDGALATLSTVADMGRFAVASPIPLGLALRPQLLAGTLTLLFGPGHRRVLAPSDPGVEAPDGSFLWLLEHHTRAPLRESLPVREIRGHVSRWTAGHPRLPESQYAVVTDPGDDAMVRSLGDAALTTGHRSPSRGQPFALLMYRAGQHGPLRKVGHCLRWELYRTGHAVSVYDPVTDSHSWVYVNSEPLHPAYGSIEGVACDRGVVVIDVQRGRDRHLVVSAPDLGRYGYLPIAATAFWRLESEQGILVAGQARYELMDLRRRITVPPRKATAYQFGGLVSVQDSGTFIP